MLGNYLKTTWRNLWKSKFYSGINVAGLALGLTVGILILVWVQDELSYDRFHTSSRNIYRVLANVGSGTSRQTWTAVPAPLATKAISEIPEVSNTVRIKVNEEYSLFQYNDKKFTGQSAAYVDPSFFSVFDFRLLKGDPEKPFPTINSVILTASSARRYFGEENPMGKSLRADNKENFIVSGILEDFPGNSSIKQDLLFPMSYYARNSGGEGATIEEDWGNYQFETYLLLHEGSGVKPVEAKLAVIKATYKGGGAGSPFSLQPIARMHLYQADGSEGRIQTVRTFLVVAILILLIASINYVNLSTARSMLRIKEVSVRKIIGAGRIQLFLQFIAETVMMFVFALIAAFLLIRLFLPVFNNMAAKDMEIGFFDGEFWGITVLAVVFSLILSSIYPALLLSSFEPLKALRGRISGGISTAAFRKFLVTVQFVFSVAMIAGTLIVGLQLNYVQEKALGYEKKHVFSFDIKAIGKNYETAKAELLKQPGVLEISCSENPIVNLDRTTGDTDWDGKDPEQGFMIHPLTVDEDFLSLFRIELIAGRGFTGAASDSSHYILNETAVREAGIADPIGKRFSLWDTEGTIIGVVSDFHVASLREKIEPVIFQYQPANSVLYANSKMYVKTNGKDAAKAIAAAGKLWQQYNPAFPFEYRFLDETYDNLYKSEQRTGTLFNIFAVVAILISCMGLFGLATYTAQVKIKEVGIRKVLGASVTNVVTLLSRDFIRLVLMAIVIATPLAWYAMNRWLQDFAYSVSIEWWMFALAGVLALVIALLTVSFQSVKAALMNPVKSLRSE